jgi:hypothetical protein
MRRADIEVPNCAVNMNYRAQLACYPRGNLSPLINGVSTYCQRVTWTYFRNCSGCPPHSKADLCPCTLHPISIRIESTFVRLRYSLAGNRPSQTTHHALSSNRITIRVRNKTFIGWYYTDASTTPDEVISKAPTYSLQ